ncbi:2Fe-2S iron-sulfur cluster-binding protein [Paenibacillus pini]|nr:2Fe-2S iron-sulfur cluster-binding protein [Paenibacillus pini]
MDYDIEFRPSGKKVKVRAGLPVLDAARRAGVPIPTRCGGKMGCLMCKVEAQGEDGKKLSAPKEAELRKLGSLANQGIRLACQAKVEGSVTVTVPEDRLKAAIRKQLEAAKNCDNDDTLW